MNGNTQTHTHTHTKRNIAESMVIQWNPSSINYEIGKDYKIQRNTS